MWNQFWNTTDAPLTSRWASTEMFLVGRGWGGRLFEGGRFLNFLDFQGERLFGGGRFIK